MSIGNGFDPDFAAASDWAKLYRAAGIQVVPCKDKRPLLKKWKEYQDALVPQPQFDAWYGAQGAYVSHYDMGMLTGAASGRILMIDLDFYKAGGDAAKQWWGGVLMTHNHGMTLETWQQRTGGGGIQLFFSYPPGWKFAVNSKTSINVDIRCQGGFAVLPPTTHASGDAYVWEAGLAPWDIEILAAPDWLLEEVEKLVAAHGHVSRETSNGHDGHAQNAQNAQNAQYDSFGHQTDGRETFMRDLVWGAVVDWYRECPIKPGDGESVAKSIEKYRVYEAQVSVRGAYQAGTPKADALDAEGRGPAEFARKWHYAMGLWDTKVAEEANKPGSKRENRGGFDYTDEYRADPKNVGDAPAGDIYPFLDVDQIMDKADPIWVVDGIVNERALGFIFGPPSSLKTFIALDLALSLAARLPQWWDRGISRHGAVVYLCREGTSSFKFRIQAWEIHRQCKARGQPFYLIEYPCNFMNDDDVIKLVATVKVIMAKAGVPIAAVFVDTVSRVLPGAEENLQKDMSLFVRACEYIQHEFQCIVIGVHHTNKNGGIRGSTVIPGAGDFLLETRRETGEMAGTMVLQKVKDGEDGVELAFKVTKIDITGIVPRTSLVVDPMVVVARKDAGSGWPDIAVCREILTAIDQQWWRKTPWCYATNTSRSAITNIMNRWQLKRSIVKDILEKWVANEIIVEAECDTKTHAKGYKKLTNI